MSKLAQATAEIVPIIVRLKLLIPILLTPNMAPYSALNASLDGARRTMALRGQISDPRFKPTFSTGILSSGGRHDNHHYATVCRNMAVRQVDSGDGAPHNLFCVVVRKPQPRS